MQHGNIVASFVLMISTNPLAAADMPAPTTIDAAGAAFPAVIAGEGTPVIFVHGSFSDYRAWAGLWEQVASGHRFIAYSQRGFGTGEWPADGGYSADIHTADLEAILKTIGEPVALVGWSYSGAIVLRTAVDLPDLVQSVVIYEPTMPEILAGTPEGEAARDDWFGIWAPMGPAVDAGDYTKAVRLGIEAALGLPEGGFSTQDPGLQQMQLENAHTIPLDANAPAPTDLLCDELGKIRAPTLIVAGSERIPRGS